MSFPTSPVNGQQATVNGIVYNYNSTKGAWIKNATTAGTLTTGNLVITSNTASTNTLNGALTIAGGVGISQNLNVSGAAKFGADTISNVVAAATTTSTSTTTGALVVRGGIGAAGNIVLSGDMQTTAAGFGSVSSRFTANTAVKGDIHITPPGNGANATSTLQYGITFSPGANVSNTQAAILISENGSDGTAIGFYTTNNYATGPQFRAAVTPTGELQFNSGYGSVATAYGCRAWVNFDGTGTVGVSQTIRASGGVTSVSKSATGIYGVNVTTALPDANYAVIASCNPQGYSGAYAGSGSTGGGTNSTTVAYVELRDTNNTNANSNYIMVAIFR